MKKWYVFIILSCFVRISFSQSMIIPRNQIETLISYNQTSNLPPSTPQISQVVFKYTTYNIKFQEEFIDNYLECDIFSENCDDLYIITTEPWTYPEILDDNLIIYSKINKELIGNDLYHIKVPLGENWKCGICFQAFNQYGCSAVSDTIYLNHYISKDILKQREEYYTNIKETTEEKKDISIVGLNVKSRKRWKQLLVVDLLGKCLYSNRNYQEEITLPISLKGYYIVKIVYTNNVITKKIKL